jgi:hypothetical protein
MKKSLFYILFLAIISGACLQDQTNPLTVATCYDGIRNQNEKAIDCGGPCLSCAASPCTKELEDNILYYNGSQMTVGGSDYDYDCYRENNAYVFDIELRYNATLQIILGGAPPKEDKIYPISKTPKDGSAIVVMQDQSTTYYATTGNVYVVVNNGKIEAELCSVTVTYATWATEFTGRVISK